MVWPKVNLLEFKDVTQALSDYETYLTQQWIYINRIQYMFGVKQIYIYFPPPVAEDELVQTLLQQGLKWKEIETYHVGSLMLRKAQINGLS